MPRGRTTSLTIRLTPAERLTLLAWQRAPSIPAGHARRARLLLLLADGMTITDAAATVGLSRRHSYKWIRRFVQQGLEGLEEQPGRGRRPPPLPDLREEPHNLDAGEGVPVGAHDRRGVAP
jgi:Helix-turn-helix domain